MVSRINMNTSIRTTATKSSCINDNNRQRIRKKSVRFAPDERLCDYSPTVLVKILTDELCHRIWFQHDEFDAFQKESKDASASAIRKGLPAYISRTYGHTDKKTQDMYNLWARCSDSRRGLERFINEEYGRTRKQKQQRTVQAVLYAQNQLRHEEELDFDLEDDCSRASQVIRNVSTSISKDAAAFAAMLGKADHAAVAPRRRPVVSAPKGAKPGVTVVRRVPSINRRNSRTPVTAPPSSVTRPSFPASSSPSSTETAQKPRPLMRRNPVVSRKPSFIERVNNKSSSANNKCIMSEDDSENSDTVPAVRLSPEQQREKRQQRDQQKLFQQANLDKYGRRLQRGTTKEISWVPRR